MYLGVYVSGVLGCVCLVYSGECVILFIKMMEVVDTQNGPYCMYTNSMTVFRVVVSYTCNVSGLVGSKWIVHVRSVSPSVHLAN